jgi:hypothetical protein
MCNLCGPNMYMCAKYVNMYISSATVFQKLTHNKIDRRLSVSRGSVVETCYHTQRGLEQYIYTT